MEMPEVFEKLRSLQDVLVQKYAIEAEIQEAPSRHSRDNELLERQKQEYIEKNKEYERIKSRVLELREQLSASEAKREECEKNMDNTTTQREFELLSKEIHDAEIVSQQVRKDLQREEHDLEELDDRMKSDEELIQEQESYLKEVTDKIDSDISLQKAKLAELEEEIRTITPGLDSEVVFKFERIIKSKSKEKGEKEGGIVHVKGNVCTGCHMILPAQFANLVRKGNSIEFCPYCSRILYYLEGSEDTGIEVSETVSADDDETSHDIDDFLDAEETEEIESELLDED